MLLQPQASDSARAGDVARRRARYAVLAFLIGMPASLWLFARLPQIYLATDPIAFWQGVGFWLIVAAAVAYPAWRYWRGKFARPR
jgi:hypothetical protein